MTKELGIFVDEIQPKRFHEESSLRWKRMTETISNFSFELWFPRNYRVLDLVEAKGR